MQTKRGEGRRGEEEGGRVGEAMMLSHYPLQFTDQCHNYQSWRSNSWSNNEALPLPTRVFAQTLLLVSSNAFQSPDKTCANLPRVLCCHGGGPHGLGFSRGLRSAHSLEPRRKHCSFTQTPVQLAVVKHFTSSVWMLCDQSCH